jgi:hypothetical protein
MATRSSIQFSVEPGTLLRRLPPRFRKIVDPSVVGEVLADLFVFETGDGHVVASKDLTKALSKYGDSSGRLVVVGHDFTQEVRLSINERAEVCYSPSGTLGGPMNGGMQSSSGNSLPNLAVPRSRRLPSAGFSKVPAALLRKWRCACQKRLVARQHVNLRRGVKLKLVAV